MVATSDFLISNDDWRLSSWNLIESANRFTPENRSSLLALHSRAAKFTRLTNDHCIEQYVDPLTATSELVLVSSQTASTNNHTSILDGWISGSDGPHWDGASLWICYAYEGEGTWKSQCDLDYALPFANDWKLLVNQANVTIQYCLVGEQADNSTRCGLHYSLPLLVIVCVCISIDTAIIACIAVAMNQPTLLRLGDALSELLEKYDQSPSARLEENRGYLQPTIVRLGSRPWPMARGTSWFKAVSKLCWVVSITV